jgi:hypothetical protein
MNNQQGDNIRNPSTLNNREEQSCLHLSKLYILGLKSRSFEKMIFSNISFAATNEKNIVKMVKSGKGWKRQTKQVYFQFPS